MKTCLCSIHLSNTLNFFTFLSENCVVSNSTTYVDPALMFQAKEEGKFKLIMFALGIRQ